MSSFTGPSLSEFVISASFGDTQNSDLIASPTRRVLGGRRSIRQTPSRPGREKLRKRSNTDPARDILDDNSDNVFRLDEDYVEPDNLSDNDRATSKGMLPNAPNSLSGTTGHIKSAYSMVQDSPSFVLRNTNSGFTGHLAEIEGTVDAHQTKSIHDIVIRNPIASKLFCALFDVGSTHKHIAALRIVTGLLERSKHFCESFRNISEKHSGFLIILYLLTKQSQKWSTDTFHVLIEPLTVSIGRAGVSEEGLRWIFTLVMDMLYFAQDDDILFGRVVEMIVDVILLNEDKGLIFLDSQPFGGSGKGSTLFIIASLMHELKKRHKEEHFNSTKN